jgi:hypothetical protein
VALGLLAALALLVLVTRRRRRRHGPSELGQVSDGWMSHQRRQSEDADRWLPVVKGPSP